MEYHKLSYIYTDLMLIIDEDESRYCGALQCTLEMVERLADDLGVTLEMIEIDD